MSDPIKMLVLKPCWLLGRIAEVGDLVKLPPDDAVNAVDSGRVEPADDHARALLRVAAVVERDKLLSRLAREARR